MAGREVSILLVVGFQGLRGPQLPTARWRQYHPGLALRRLDLPIRLLQLCPVGQLPIDEFPVAELPVVLMELALPPLTLELVLGAVVVVVVVDVVVVRLVGGEPISHVVTSPSWHCSPPRTRQSWLWLGSLSGSTPCRKAGLC